MTTSSAPPLETLSLLLKSLKLPYIHQQWQEMERQALQHGWTHAQFLMSLCEIEATQRYQTRVTRSLKDALLPLGKAFANFDFSQCPTLNPATVLPLSQDKSWLQRGDNLLLFGPSGVGKTHLAAAMGRALVELGARVRFTAATTLVQQLQAAKVNLQLQAALAKLDKYDLLILDDLTYVKKSEAETSVLFELIAHRYEVRSLLITANHPFSAWDTIFADTTMTVAAVDRLVHHAIILDIQAQSFRQQSAKQRASTTTENRSK